MYDLSKNKGKPNINLTFYVRFSTLASTSVAFSSSPSLGHPLLLAIPSLWPLETFCALSLGKIKYATAAAAASAAAPLLLLLLYHRLLLRLRPCISSPFGLEPCPAECQTNEPAINFMAK